MPNIFKIYAILFSIASTFVKSTSTHKKMVSILSHFPILLLPLFRRLLPVSRKKNKYIQKGVHYLEVGSFFLREWPLFPKYISPPFEKSLNFPEKHFYFLKKLLPLSRVLLTLFRKILPLSRKK